MSAPQDDEQQRFALGLIFALVAAVVIFAITFGYHHVRKLAATRAAPAAAAAPAVVDVEVARVVVENGVVKFYFETGKALVAEGANTALAEVVQGVAGGRMAVISGFHDATGDAAVNAELARQRAFAVRDVLKELGVTEDKLTLEKPAQTLGTGSLAEARRVEVKLQ